MAKDLIPAQENCSILFFETLLKARFNLSDEGYAQLDKKAFGKGGVYPKATQVWKRSFDEQVLGLGTYLISRSIPTTGWVWSRGNGMMGYLERICTTRCGSTVKAWNPMDVVAVQKGKETELKKEIDENTQNGDKEMNMRMLNAIMKDAILNKELMPISLKQVGKNERGAFEMSKDLQGRNAKLRSYHEFVAKNFKCDLEWSVYKNEWRVAQEISWDMIDAGGGGRKPFGVHVQGRTFQAKKPREKPQHSGAVIKGTGAMLGKSAIDEINPFVKKNFRVVSKKKPSVTELKILIFAFNICRFVKSNAIVLAKNNTTVGIGSGQPSRLDSCKIAINKMHQFQKTNNTDGIVAASDAFFPFVDGIETLVQAGISAVIQPSGSIRDKEIIKFANQTETVLVFSKTRHFKH